MSDMPIHGETRKTAPTRVAPIHFVLAAALAAALFALPARAEQVELTVLFTSDMHAHVLPSDDVREKPARGSIAQAATLITRIRGERPNTIVLDGGDAIQGTPLSHYALVAPGADGVDPTIAAMNLVGYDAAVLGNHEFNYGLDVLRRSLGQSRFPWLAANMTGAREARLPVGDDLVVTRGGVRVGILGLTNPNIPHWDPESHWRGLAFTDLLEVARVRVAALRTRADVVIVLLHTGFERNLDSGAVDGSDFENFAWRVAQVPGIDLLLTGHTHVNIPPRQVNGTWVAQPGRWAEFVTRFDLTLERSGGAVRITRTAGVNLPTGMEVPRDDVLASGAAIHARTLAELARPIGTLETPLRISGVPSRDDAGIDLIHAVQLEASGADLSLAAPLGFSRIEFQAGPATPRLAHALYPYPNTLVVVRISGAQLADVLEHAVRGWQTVECKATGCTLLRDPEFPSYNYDNLAGATYLVDPTAPVGHRIRGLRVKGAAVAPQQLFTLAINSYRAAGGGNYPYLATAERIREIDRPMVELLIEYFTRHGRITPAADDNWAFILPLREAVMSNAGASTTPKPDAGPAAIQATPGL